MRRLPERWANAALSEVTEVIMGQSPPSSAYNDVGLGLPFLQGKAEFGALRPMPVKWCTDARKVAEADDILVSVRAPVGPTNLSPTRCCIGRGLAALRPLAGLETRFLLYQIRAREHELERLGHGVTFKAIRKKELTSWPTLVAPLPEQHRIVAKIESLFAKLDEGVAALKRAEANLERYRASVLKAAVEGRLTEQWRRENPPTETGEDLLRRILAERRKRWEAVQLAKFEAKGRKPPKNWKAKYKEPATPDTSGLPRLPEGWCWATVDQVSDGVHYGSSTKTSTEHEGVPVLRMGNIQDGMLNLDNLK
ncbi:MAG: restriction endonuclease subunit S, partial [Gammaproteobacteria bacterium]|nr:restriction endonuclease subunit S [Gammaproteobacteria bacterium]